MNRDLTASFFGHEGEFLHVSAGGDFYEVDSFRKSGHKAVADLVIDSVEARFGTKG